MYKVRVGNDINIQWRIFRNDSPEDFAGKTLRLLMRGTSQTIEVRDYVLEGNVIKWEFKGKDQRGPSTFTFTLIENEGKDDMFTIDKCDVLRLVSCSCQADDDDGRFDMFIDTDIVLPSNGVDGKTPVLESGETQTLEPGSEATSEIVPNGQDEAGNPRYKVNFGIPAGEPFAYDDFTPEQIEGLKKPALDAAAVAVAAADAATKAAANADNAAKEATEAALSAVDAADGASQAAVDAGLAKTAAEEAAVKATEAAGAAGSAAEEASSAAEAAIQTNTEVGTAEQDRVTAEEQRAAAEQTRQTEFSQLKQDAQTATQEANAAAQAANQAAESIEESLSAKQDKTDESLQTSDKTVIGAINEVNQAVKTKQDKLKAGTGVEITPENTVNVTLDTTVFKVVASLPESPAAGDENKIHLVPAESTEEGNIYTEYVFVGGKWEEFGTYRSEVDLTPYLKKTDAESTYQKITDNALSTTAKTVVGAINEVNKKVSEIPESETYEITLHSSVMAGGKRPEELTSEEIDAAIGGWDNFKAAILEGKFIKEIVNYSSDDATLQTNVSYEASITTVPSDDIESIALSISRLENYILGSYYAINIQILNNNGVLTLSYLAKQVFIEGEEYRDLQTTDKTIIGAINELKSSADTNAGNVTRIDRAVGNPVIEEVDFSTFDEPGTYFNNFGVKASQDNYSIKHIFLEKGDLLIANIRATNTVAILTATDSSHAVAANLIPSSGVDGEYITVSYIADSDKYISISCLNAVMNHSAHIIKSPFNTAISDNSYMQYLHKVYEEYGAVYNKETGYWELNGLTDLTEEDMWDIYVENIGVSFGTQINDNYMLRLWPFRNARIRFIRIEDSEYCNLSAFVFCRENYKLEVFRCMNASGAETKLKISGRATGLFFGCTKLKDAGMINVSQVGIFIDKNILAFTKCAKLSRVLLMNLKVDISFQDSPLLSYESLNYLITNAANTAAITVTVHPATYSYLTGTAQPTAEVGGTTEEWQALVTSAQAKQISFAVPEETQSEVTE